MKICDRNKFPQAYLPYFFIEILIFLSFLYCFISSLHFFKYLPKVHSPEGKVHLYRVCVHVAERGAEHRHPMEGDHST